MVKSANLCWGQRYMWMRIHQLPPRHQHETHIVLRLPVPAGLTVDRCRVLVTHLTKRHETLRTTFRVGLRPQQQPQRPAPLPVPEVTTERDGTAAPGQVIKDLSTRPFDLSGEWPIRACVITSGGAPKHLVLVFNHLAVDAWTITEIKRELRAQAMAASRSAPPPPVRRQPRDLARHEESADAALLGASAVAYWREEIARLPADPFAARRRSRAEYPEDPPAHHATLASPTMPAAARKIAARCEVWPSAVYAAAHAALMAAYTGQGMLGYLAFVSNRDGHPYPDVLTCMFSPALVRVDCTDDPPFTDLVRRVAAATKRATDHAYLPYDEVIELISREGSRRGQPFRLGSEVNFIKQRSGEYTGDRSAVTWHAVPEAWAQYGSDTYVRFDEWRNAVSVALHASAEVMNATAMESLLRGHEAAILAHADPAADLPISKIADLARLPAAPALPRQAPARSLWTGDAKAPKVQILTSVVRRTHDLARIDPSDSYTLAGGRALAIPHVLAELHAQGWDGPTPNDLAGPEPLGSLADRLLRPSTGYHPGGVTP